MSEDQWTLTALLGRRNKKSRRSKIRSKMDLDQSPNLQRIAAVRARKNKECANSEADPGP